ncbi:MAG: CBS domain-containing protein [Acidimicrobiia bacterium]
MNPRAALTVADLRLRPPERLGEHTTLQEATAAMLRERSTAVLLDGAVLRILTELDVVRAVALGRGPDARAAQFATPEPLTIDAATPVLEAVDLMVRHGVRHLVVADRARRVTGILAVQAAAAALLGSTEVPPWLPALRLALRVEWREDVTT